VTWGKRCAVTSCLQRQGLRPGLPTANRQPLHVAVASEDDEWKHFRAMFYVSYIRFFCTL